jgi:predicted dehydrogenase
MDRRTFLIAGGGMGLVAQPPAHPLIVGLIGSGGRGRYLAKIFLRDTSVRIVAICDVYEPNLEAGLQVTGNQARPYRNYKALLEGKDIGAVIVATPEHWHRWMLLDALAASKDVYVEKPLCRTPQEGAELVEAARQSKSVIQIGMQRRSYDLYLKARNIVKTGTLGQVRMVRSWWLNSDIQPSRKQLEGPLDWEQWQGPARKYPLTAARFFDWRSYSDYSGGIMADQGAHVYDGINMLMDAGYPQAVTASAGHIHKPDGDLPESVVVAAEYSDFVAVFIINYAAMHYIQRNDQLNQFDGDKARLDIGRETFAVYGAGAESTPAMMEISKGMSIASEAHVANFLECIRTRAVPNASVEMGFQAVLVPQMANLPLRTGGVSGGI